MLMDTCCFSFFLWHAICKTKNIFFTTLLIFPDCHATRENSSSNQPVCWHQLKPWQVALFHVAIFILEVDASDYGCVELHDILHWFLLWRFARQWQWKKGKTDITQPMCIHTACNQEQTKNKSVNILMIYVIYMWYLHHHNAFVGKLFLVYHVKLQFTEFVLIIFQFLLIEIISCMYVWNVHNLDSVSKTL